MGGHLGVTGGSLEFHPPSWPYCCNERVRNSNAIVRGHRFAMGSVPYIVGQCAVRGVALYKKNDGKRKEGAKLLGDG